MGLSITKDSCQRTLVVLMPKKNTVKFMQVAYKRDWNKK
jgi:hypothetical protein